MIINNPYTGGTARKVCLHAHIKSKAGSTWPSYNEAQQYGDDANHLLNSSYVGNGADYATKDGETYTSFVDLCDAAGFDAVAITSHEYLENAQDELAAKGIVWIPSSELADDVSQVNDTHICGIGLYDTTATSLEDAVCVGKTGQQIIDAVNTRSGFSIIAHPNHDEGNYSITLDELKAFTDYRGIEIINNWEASNHGFLTDAQVYADGTGGGTNMIDPILAEVASGTRPEFINLIGTSDFHRFKQFVVDTWYDMTIDSAFQMVYSDTLTLDAIKSNVRSGNNYATEGPLLSSAPSVNGDTITITTADSCTCKWIKEGGVTAQSDSAATTFTFTMTDESYIRADFTRVSDSRRMWTNPFFSSDQSNLYMVKHGDNLHTIDPYRLESGSPATIIVDGTRHTYQVKNGVFQKIPNPAKLVCRVSAG